MFTGNDTVVVWVNAMSGKNVPTKKTTVPGRNFHSLSFRLRGKITVETGRQSLISGANSITFIPKGCTYDTEIQQEMELMWIHFQTLEELPDLQPMVIQPLYPVVLRNLFTALCERYTFGRERDYVCMSLIYEILAELSMEIMQRMPVPKRMREAREYIDMHYSEPISIAALAEKAGVSETYFRREFKACFSCPPAVYLKNIRLQNVKMLLDTGYYTVSEAAVLCGFHSASYLSHEFHIRNGITPKEYLKKLKK